MTFSVAFSVAFSAAAPLEAPLTSLLLCLGTTGTIGSAGTACLGASLVAAVGVTLIFDAVAAERVEFGVVGDVDGHSEG